MFSTQKSLDGKEQLMNGDCDTLREDLLKVCKCWEAAVRWRGLELVPQLRFGAHGYARLPLRETNSLKRMRPIPALQ